MAFPLCGSVKKGAKYKSLKDLVEAAKAPTRKIEAGLLPRPLVQNDPLAMCC